MLVFPSEGRFEPMESQEILQKLRRDVDAASARLVSANEDFDAIIRESPSGLPHPDGVHRIRNSAKALSIARQEHVEAVVRLNAFVSQGIVPNNMRKGQGQEESSRVKKLGEP